MEGTDENVDYCGIIILLRQLIADGSSSKAEGQKSYPESLLLMMNHYKALIVVLFVC